jgi:hypothetical protein
MRASGAALVCEAVSGNQSRWAQGLEAMGSTLADASQSLFSLDRVGNLATHIDRTDLTSLIVTPFINGRNVKFLVSSVLDNLEKDSVNRLNYRAIPRA